MHSSSEGVLWRGMVELLAEGRRGWGNLFEADMIFAFNPSQLFRVIINYSQVIKVCSE